MFKYIIILTLIINFCNSFNIGNIKDFSENQISKAMDVIFKTNAVFASKTLVESSEGNVKPNVLLSQVDNAIYFYSPLTEESALDLEKKLISLNNRNLKEGTKNPIHLHIQSFGGSLFHTLYLVDLIKNLEIPVYTYVDGFAASAGTLLSVSGKKRFITKNSIMLIHQLSSGVQGKFSEIQDEFHNVETLMNIINDIYLENSKLKIDELRELLRHDLWLKSKECLKYGLVDEII